MEEQMAAVVTALSHMTTDIRDIKRDMEKNIDSIDALRILQKEQNSNVANLTEKESDDRKWINKHNDWHGIEDKKVIERVHKEEVAQAKRDQTWKVLGLEWKIVAAVTGSGLFGLFAPKLLRLVERLI